MLAHKNVVTLYQLPRPQMKRFPNFSGPCAKLETYLRMSRTPYTMKETLPMSGPYGKVPYIKVKGKTIPDSQICIWNLQKMKLAGFVDIDAHLSHHERILVESVRVMLEESVYIQLAYERWVNPKNANTTLQILLGHIPFPLRNFIFLKASKTKKHDLEAHGFGRYTKSQQQLFCQKAIDSVADILGDHPYMLGQRCCSLDAIVYGHLAHVLYSSDVWPDVPVSVYLRSKENLVRYIERMTEQYFPELVKSQED
ncbi:hypothetical protein HK098_007469 [Nowakowskiella sp. JEL0407]|nr:hypothetical protein HK098_007469 [Nowakowskiella sp. JEL0407]